MIAIEDETSVRSIEYNYSEVTKFKTRIHAQRPPQERMLPITEDAESKIERSSSVDDPFLEYVYREAEMPIYAEGADVVQTIWEEHKILIIVGSSIGSVVLIVLLISVILSIKSRVSRRKFTNNSNKPGGPQELKIEDGTEQKFSFREQRVLSLFMKSKK